MTLPRNVLRELDRMGPALTDLLRPIRDQQDARRVSDVLDELSDMMEHPDDPRYAGVFRLLLSELHRWEQQHEPPLPDVRPHEMLAFLMEQRGLGNNELARALGMDRANLSRLVRGERELTAAHVRRLSEFFGVSSEVFLPGGT